MGKKLLARLVGVCLFLFCAVPSLACGIYALVHQDHPENLPTYLGLTDSRILGGMPGIGFTLVGCMHAFLGALFLVTAVTLAFWPDRVLEDIGKAWRVIARRTSACSGCGQSVSRRDDGEE